MHHDLQGLAQPGGALSGVGVLVELTVEGQVLVAPEGPSQNLDVLPGAAQGSVGRLAVPALDHLWARHAEAQN